MKQGQSIVLVSDINTGGKYCAGVYDSKEKAKEDTGRIFAEYIERKYSGVSRKIKVIPVDELSEVLERKFNNIYCSDNDGGYVLECKNVVGWLMNGISAVKIAEIEVISSDVGFMVEGNGKEFKQELRQILENPRMSIRTRTKSKSKSGADVEDKIGVWKKVNKSWVHKDAGTNLVNKRELFQSLSKRRKVLGESQFENETETETENDKRNDKRNDK